MLLQCKYSGCITCPMSYHVHYADYTTNLLLLLNNQDGCPPFFISIPIINITSISPKSVVVQRERLSIEPIVAHSVRVRTAN